MVMLGLEERVHRGIPARLVDVVGQRIVSGGWPSASSFRIQDLQDEFQVSVTVAREVVLALQSKGLVESRPKRGVTILERSPGTCWTRMYSPGMPPVEVDSLPIWSRPACSSSPGLLLRQPSDRTVRRSPGVVEL